MADAARVLVVEDTAVVRALVVQVLESHGFAATEAGSAEDGLRAVTANPPDALVLDHHLPGMSGTALLRLIRASPDARVRALPVVGVSGCRDGEREEFLRAGATCFLEKPFRQPDLIEALRAALGA